MKKIVKKTTKETVTPDIIVNCLDCETSKDIYKAFIDAKVRAGKPITKDELELVENIAVEENPKIVVFTECRICEPIKKTPWYKRMWRWFTHKK